MSVIFFVLLPTWAFS